MSQIQSGLGFRPLLGPSIFETAPRPSYHQLPSSAPPFGRRCLRFATRTAATILLPERTANAPPLAWAYLSTTIIWLTKRVNSIVGFGKSSDVITNGASVGIAAIRDNDVMVELAVNSIAMKAPVFKQHFRLGLCSCPRRLHQTAPQKAASIPHQNEHTCSPSRPSDARLTRWRQRNAHFVPSFVPERVSIANSLNLFSVTS